MNDNQKIKAPLECETKDDVRVEIDRIDRALVSLLSERWGYVDRISQLKSSPEEATVPWRIQQVVDKVRAIAEENKLPPELAEDIWRRLIEWGIKYEEEKLRANDEADQAE